MIEMTMYCGGPHASDFYEVLMWTSRFKGGSFRVRSTNFLLNFRDPTPILMKFGTLGDYA